MCWMIRQFFCTWYVNMLPNHLSDISSNLADSHMKMKYKDLLKVLNHQIKKIGLILIMINLFHSINPGRLSFWSTFEFWLLRFSFLPRSNFPPSQKNRIWIIPSIYLGSFDYKEEIQNLEQVTYGTQYKQVFTILSLTSIIKASWQYFET